MFWIPKIREITTINRANGLLVSPTHRIIVRRVISYIQWKRKADLIVQILCRNWLVKHVIARRIKGKSEVNWRRRRRRKQLPDNLKETSGLKEEALNRSLWGTRFDRFYGPVLRQNTEWMNQLYVSEKQGQCTSYAAIASSVYFKLNSCWTFSTWGSDVIIFVDKPRHDNGSNNQQCRLRGLELNAKKD
jgi:hypothetical protein